MSTVRKIFKISIVILMVAGMFTFGSCSKSETQEGEGETGGLKPHKIGVILYGKDDPAAAALYKNINMAGEALNCEIVWAVGSLDPNDQITDAQNLIAAGVEGISAVPLNEIATQKIMQLCEENNIYFSIFLREIVDSEIRREVEGSNYWVGNSTEDNYALGAEIMQYLYDQGSRNVGLLLGVGEQSYEVSRNNAFKDKAKELGMNILAEATPLIGTNDAIGAVENFLTSYPQMDGIAVTCGATGQGEIIMATIERLGKNGTVKVGVCDTFDGMYDAFTKEALHITAGGFYSDGIYNLMWLYNAVDGYPLTQEKAQSLIMPVIFVHNATECEQYNAYIDTPNFDMWRPEDILTMVKRLHPELTLEKMQEIMYDFTLENIVAKSN